MCYLRTIKPRRNSKYFFFAFKLINLQHYLNHFLIFLLLSHLWDLAKRERILFIFLPTCLLETVVFPFSSNWQLLVNLEEDLLFLPLFTERAVFLHTQSFPFFMHTPVDYSVRKPGSLFLTVSVPEKGSKVNFLFRFSMSKADLFRVIIYKSSKLGMDL